MAASKMEPTVGASTCAFGSHKWRRKIGSFTKNTTNIKVLNKKENLLE